jgi:hypothetical protein
MILVTSKENPSKEFYPSRIQLLLTRLFKGLRIQKYYKIESLKVYFKCAAFSLPLSRRSIVNFIPKNNINSPKSVLPHMQTLDLKQMQ